MRPAQIRVFDGLRLTTEHLDHLQEALRSGIQDLRGLLGPGAICRGFEVVADGEEAVTVQPGLAFDYRQNRLVSDEPRTVPVTFGPGEEAQFVCLKYEQIEDGQVEGHFTLLWDSCSVVLRPTAPEPQDNLVVLARVSKAADGGLGVDSPDRPGEDEGTEPGDAGATAPDDGTSTTDATTAIGTAPDTAEPPVSDAPPEPTGGIVPVPGPGAVAPAPDDASAPAPPVALWAIQQGVERLSGESGAGTDLGALLIGPLRNALAAGQGAGTEVRIGLVEREVPVSFPPVGLTCQALLSATISANGPVERAPDAPEPVAPPPTRFTAQVTARGEATFADGGVQQFGVSTMQAGPGAAGPAGWPAELTELGIGHLPFGVSSPAGPAPGTLDEMLRHLQLLLRVERWAGGFTLIGNLRWVGEASEEIIGGIATWRPALVWEGSLAWKATGGSR